MARKLSILSILYFVQGLPYGFQLIALPVYLRAEGMSLAGIGLASALALPWSLKVVWGPWVDRFGSAVVGRRKSWILPLQLLLAVACGATAWVEPAGALRTLLILVLLMNLFASAMDVAVDALAVDLLPIHELGHGNIAQVVGYKLGMLTGGGLLVQASGQIGWNGLFFSMSGLVLVSFLLVLGFREPDPPASSDPSASPAPSGAANRGAAPSDEQVSNGPARDEAPERPTLMGVLRLLGVALRTKGSFWVLLFIATYKLGESMADTMWKPFLYDSGFTAQQIGAWLGTWGLGFSLLGSFAGGLLASRVGVVPAVAITAFLRAFAVAGEWGLTLVEPTAGAVIGVVVAEHAFGGALTTSMFAFMMSRVDRRIGATHYTLFATIEVTGKLVASWLSGFVAQAAGYPTLFGLATFLAFAFLGLLIPILRPIETETTPEGPGEGYVGIE